MESLQPPASGNKKSNIIGVNSEPLTCRFVDGAGWGRGGGCIEPEASGRGKVEG